MIGNHLSLLGLVVVLTGTQLVGQAPGGTSSSTKPDPSRRSTPNIVYVLADDLGVGDVSALNAKSAWKTPHLDQLAAEGMRFTDAHSPSAVCTPTRYGILTGRYAWRTRLKNGVLWGKSPPLIAPSRTTVASFLKRQGYRTSCIGKWHLGLDLTPESVEKAGEVRQGPTSLGFTQAFFHSASLDMPPYVWIENGRVRAAPDRITQNTDFQGFWRKGETGADFSHEEVLPELTRRAVAQIRQDVAAKAPFFLYLALSAPHTPILPTRAFRGKSGTNAYGDFVLQVDDTVGQLLRVLEELGATRDTLFIFTSDNGCSPRARYEELATFGHDPSGGFRGHKADIYEGGHRVPFLVRWPARVASGRASSEVICLTDLLRTSAEITGVELGAAEGVDSVSFLPALLGKKTEPLREATVHHSINGSFAIRQGRWKLALCPGSGGWSAPKPKAARAQRLPLRQLFDLGADPGEETNLVERHPKVVEKLEALLRRYVEEGRSTPGPRQANDAVTTFAPTPYSPEPAVK